ncbi:MAG: hypothetical protein LBH03_02025 [Holophagales bacterium]|nr:hypothetical protein [Holophagales bacterium]
MKYRLSGVRMDYFGSYKLRITWASISIFLFGFFLVAFRTSNGPDGFAIHAFGVTIPQNLLASMDALADPMQLMRSFLRAFIGWVVPFTFLFTAYFPLVDAIESDKLKGFFLGALVGSANGFFYSQILILPIWAFCARIMGSIIPGSLALADLHAVVLGLQLLIWSIIFNRLIRSNRGIPMILTLGFSALGTKLYYLVDFGEMFGMTIGQIKVVKFLNHFLPSEHVTEGPIAAGTLFYGIVGTLVLAALLVLIPMSGRGKVSRNKR